MQQAWLFLLDTSTSMGDPYAHPALLDDLPSSIQVPPPSKLQVAQEIVTLLVAAQAVAESGKFFPGYNKAMRVLREKKSDKKAGLIEALDEGGWQVLFVSCFVLTSFVCLVSQGGPLESAKLAPVPLEPTRHLTRSKRWGQGMRISSRSPPSTPWILGVCWTCSTSLPPVLASKATYWPV